MMSKFDFWMLVYLFSTGIFLVLTAYLNPMPLWATVACFVWCVFALLMSGGR
jgi:hypothetical protein